MHFLKKVFDFFIFSSLFIALCAVIMVVQANDLLNLKYNHNAYLLFVFFSTIYSYNFHWFLTPNAVGENDRSVWTQQHKYFHVAFFLSGLLGSAWHFFYFIDSWMWMLAPIMLTFLYSAPKLPHKTFGLLKKIAVGKTLYLAFVWTYVTAILPVVLNQESVKRADLIFCASRFFLIYGICILFDYRDRENDRREGIKSMITYFSESGINAIFTISLVAFFAVTAFLYFFEFSLLTVFCLIIPGIIVMLLFNYAKRNFSDYLYYFVLDGLMMLSSVLTFFTN